MMSTPSFFRHSSRMRAPESFTTGSSLPRAYRMQTTLASSTSLASDRRARRRDLSLGRRQPRDRHRERRAGHVVHADPMAEGHRRRLAPVLAADTHLEIRHRLAPPLDADADQLAHALLVEHRERVDGQELLLQIEGQELADVVAAVTERHLREVVRAEGEELGVPGDLVRD